MTDRTDADSPSPQEPSNGSSADDVVWPVWGATTRRPALGDDTRPNPVVPAGDAPAEPAEPHEAPAEDVETDEPSADDVAPDEPVATDAAPDEHVPDEDVPDEDGSDEDVPDEDEPDEAPAADTEPTDEPVEDEAQAAVAQTVRPEEPENEGAREDESTVEDEDEDEDDDEDVDDDDGAAEEPAPTVVVPAIFTETAASTPAAEEPVASAAGGIEPTSAPTSEPVDEPEADEASDESDASEADAGEPSDDERTAAAEATADEPAADEPAADEPAADEAAADEPAADEPAADEAAAADAAAPDAAAPDVAAAVAPTRESVFPRREAQPTTQTSRPADARGDETVVLPASAPTTPPSATSTSATPTSTAPTSTGSTPGGPARVTAGPVPTTPRDPSPFDDFEPEEHVRRWPRRLAVGAGVVVLLGAAYVGASYATADRVPRGATVAGVDIGGLSADAAVARLDEELAPTTQDAVEVLANDVQATLEPQAAGLSFDAAATVDRLTGVDLAQPRRLWDQIVGVGAQEPVTQVDEAKLTAALEALGTSLSLAPVDGAVLFVDGAAVLTDASEGWSLDQDAAADLVSRDWLVAAQPLALPTSVVEPEITQAEAQAALDDVAEPLVSAPISVVVSEKLAVLQPATLAAAAAMQPVDGDLELQLDGEALADAVVEQLPEGVLTSAADAHFEFQDGKPVLVPGEPGTTVAPEDVADAVAAVADAQDRTATVELTQTDPSESAEALEELGVKEVVSEFSTPLTSEPRRTQNIRQGLENITGVLIRPGETFSLTDALGPIDAAHGFVQAGAIVNGEHSDAWGGGLSQVSTTTFNAAYLAGMEDVEHTPHSEWFARYPEGREATIFTGVIDMKWKNSTPYGALVQGWVADGRAYVRLWGTKYWTVESSTSGRSGVVQPSTVYSTSRTCSPQSAGNPGFSVTVTRRLLLDGELKDTTSNTWRYKPQNRVVCGSPPDKDKEKDKDKESAAP
ncbi:VanW family protein [Cellulomonas sp. CW35]|uniref:VanW family protein n=1 Tax=Cellulomonas sp. CW35 TaxID=3458249 RepID=UPI0040341EA1